MSPRRRAMSPATAAVLRAVAEGTTYGFDVMDATGLASGTVYPILSRLEKRGLLESRWEDPEVERPGGRPPRRYYAVTDEGMEELRTAVERFERLGRPLPEGAG